MHSILLIISLHYLIGVDSLMLCLSANGYFVPLGIILLGIMSNWVLWRWVLWHWVLCPIGYYVFGYYGIGYCVFGYFVLPRRKSNIYKLIINNNKNLPRS